MKFQNIQDYQLLRTCLKVKELKLTPELLNLRNGLRKNFSREDISTINDITEELYQASLRGKNLTPESQREITAIMNSVPNKQVQGDVIEYMDTYVTLLEFRRLLEMPTDPERLAWLESYMLQSDEETKSSKREVQEMQEAASKDSEDKFKGESSLIEDRIHVDSEAPTTRVARFATAMLTMSPSSIAHSYAKSIEMQKSLYRLNGQNTPELMEKLGTLQRHLLDTYPKNVKAPQKHKESVLGNFIDDIRTGKDVRLAVANTAKTTRGRHVLTTLAVAGVITPLLMLALHANAQAQPVNTSRFQNLVNTPGITQIFSESQLAEIRGYEEQFAKYEQEGIVPSTTELHGLLSSIDDFYSDSIKGVLLESYNEYADANNLPRATSINFSYNDTDKNDGPHNVLTITDEKGKTQTVDTDSTNLFENNNITAIYNAERRIDGYRDELKALPGSVSTKSTILTKVQDDFYKVLDALTLDYTFERNGIVQRFFGDDLTLISTSQVDSLTQDSATPDQPIVTNEDLER